MKIRILMLLMSLFVVTPALLGTAWAEDSEIRDNARLLSKADCDGRDNRRLPAAHGNSGRRGVVSTGTNVGG
ncbi:MAG: hypothetical protein AB1540_13860 [Bdellovibrionota bacterium]